MTSRSEFSWGSAVFALPCMAAPTHALDEANERHRQRLAQLHLGTAPTLQHE